MTRSEREITIKIDQAKHAAARLEAIGEHFMAESVRGLCRTASALHETAARLHADNAALRETSR